MKTRIRATAVLGLPAVVACCSLLSPTVAAASTVSPLPPSNYTVGPVCATPPPGYAGCLALRLVPRTAAARAHTHPLGMTHSGPIRALSPQAGDYGLRPRDLLSAYNLPLAPQPASTQTIAIVDAYNDLGAVADLKIYDEEFKLPECTEAGPSHCFKKVNQKGESGNLPFPESEGLRAAREAVCKTGIEPAAGEACKEVEEADGWAGEISLDIEVAHAVCQNCKIVLVEAKSASFFDLEQSEKTAASLGATEISDSWGGPEQGVTAPADNASSFNHPGIVITVAAGDNGYLDWSAKEPLERGFADYPASSPHVVAVGGTRLGPLGTHGEWTGESVWNGNGAGGGGCSTVLTAAPWQQEVTDWSSVGCGEHRAVADVSADADPYTGVAIYDSTPESPTKPAPGWTPIGGTSLASPLVASVFALAGGAGVVEYPARTLYENELKLPSALHDVVTGSNGECLKPSNSEGLSGCTPAEETANSKCSAELICLAGPGYDGPTGVGTPDGIAAFQSPIAKEGEKQIKSEGEKGPVSGPAGAPPAAAVIPTSGTSPGVVASPGTTTSSSPGLAVQPTIRLSAFVLTPNALVALSRLRPKTSSVGFIFTLSAAARIRATLAKRIRVRGRGRWKLVPGGLTFAAIKGRNRRHLTSRGALTPGRYRLTLTPQNGGARSIVFQVR
jgi:Subtilase family